MLLEPYQTPRVTMLGSQYTSMKFPEDPKTVGNRPGGVLLLSPPSCGENQFATALNCETGSPLGVLDVGALLGSLVRQTHSRVTTRVFTATALPGSAPLSVA